jgi:hypothetical protein
MPKLRNCPFRFRAAYHVKVYAGDGPFNPPAMRHGVRHLSRAFKTKDKAEASARLSYSTLRDEPVYSGAELDYRSAACRVVVSARFVEMPAKHNFLS